MTESSAPQAKKPKWWQRPITWVITVIVGAAGAYVTDVIVSGLKSVAPTEDLVAQALGTDAFKISDLHRVHNFSEGRWGYVVAPNADLSPMFEEYDKRDDRAWAEANNAVDVGYTGWELTIEGTRDSTVEIVNIVPVLEGPCTPPLGGAVVHDKPEGQQQKIILLTDLTKTRPTFTRLDSPKDGPPEPEIRNYFGSHKITLPRGEKNTLVLRAYVAGKHCKFRYRMEYLADGKRKEFTFGTPKGQPFEVTGFLKDPTKYAWIVPTGACREKVTKPLTGAQLTQLVEGCWPRDERNGNRS